MPQIKDIQDENDIKIVVDQFYNKVNKDPLLSPFFNQYVHMDWSKHLPVMYDFWSSILLGSMKYTGLPFPKHLNLPMEKIHFDQWLNLFSQTIDENFQGSMAEEAKKRASMIAKTFQYKLGILK